MRSKYYLFIDVTKTKLTSSLIYLTDYSFNKNADKVLSHIANGNHDARKIKQIINIHCMNSSCSYKIQK